jgi:hypothetical protein
LRLVYAPGTLRFRHRPTDVRILAVILIVAVTCWIVVSTSRWFDRNRVSTGWQIAHWIAALGGFLAGLGLLLVPYHPKPTVWVMGYPIVVAGGELIHGRWSNGGGSDVAPLAMLADVGVGLAACMLPLRIAQLVSDRKRRKDAKPGATI